MEATGGDGDSVRSAVFHAVLRVRRGGKESMGGGIVGGAYDGSMYDGGEGRRVDGGDDALAGGEVLGALDRKEVALFLRGGFHDRTMRMVVVGFPERRRGRLRLNILKGAA
ncbi:hypothetical protein Tco_0946116 [Tanacetum coccineum]